MCILILDDDVGRRRELAKQLSTLGADELIICNWREIYTVPLAEECSAAFVAMNTMTDLEAARQLIRIHPELPFVVTTGTEKYAIESFLLGAQHYLCYPLMQEGLQEAISRCMLKKAE